MSKSPSQCRLRTLAFLATSIFCSNGLLALAQAQDWKPGDPIQFGAAHKSMFDAATPAGLPGSSRVVVPGTASGASSLSTGSTGINPATSAAASAQPNAMDNFLNSRSIEWKPGDPVSFGAAHHPAATGKSINGDNNPSAIEAMPSTPINTPVASPGGLQGFPVGAPGTLNGAVNPGAAGAMAQPALSGFNPAQTPSSAPSPVIGAVNAPLQDLAPAPTSYPTRAGQAIAPAATPSTMPGWAPVVPGATGFSPANGGGSLPLPKPISKKNKANKHNADRQTDAQLQQQQPPQPPKQKQKSNQADNKKSGSSGNIFSRAFHRMFGGD
jgi:hypothetical protein